QVFQWFIVSRYTTIAPLSSIEIFGQTSSIDFYFVYTPNEEAPKDFPLLIIISIVSLESGAHPFQTEDRKLIPNMPVVIFKRGCGKQQKAPCPRTIVPECSWRWSAVRLSAHGQGEQPVSPSPRAEAALQVVALVNDDKVEWR